MKLFTLSILLLLFVNCKNPNRSPQPGSGKDSIGTLAILKIDTSYPALSRMLGYFRKDSLGHIDPKVEIDRANMIKLIGDTTLLWANIGSMNPVDVTRNAYGTFFIVDLHCGAGGECEGYYLIGYTTGGRPVSPEDIGSLMADEGFEKTFDYKIVADTAVVVLTKNYDGADKLQDSSVIRFPLRIEKDSLVLPQKKDSLVIAPVKA